MKPFFFRLCVFLSSCVLPLSGWGQLTVTFPVTRAVFQRNLSNQATLTVAGLYSQYVDSIQARLVAIPAGGSVGANDAVTTNWTTIWKYLGDAAPSNSYFQGTLTGTGGWYNLEVRAHRNGAVTGSVATQPKVGIGEVFVIAGQSNASGIGDPSNPGPSAQYDQVSAVAVGYKVSPTPNPGDPGTWYPWAFPNAKDKIADPAFLHLESSVTMAPFGFSSWYWGAVGDQLVTRWHVPVAFFQAGWTGTGSQQWYESLDPNATPGSNYGYSYPAGLPYGNLRVSLTNYAAQYGVRAVLMHQGEADNEVNTSQTDYTNRWSTVISSSRSHSGKSQLPWVVARASRYKVGGVSTVNANIIAGQNALINPSNQVFAGPFTDDIVGPNMRDADSIHFMGDGHYVVAQAWADALENASINTAANPYAALSLVRIYPSCNSGTQMHLGADNGWSFYQWTDPNTNNGVNSLATGQHVDFGGGDYKLRVTDAVGNIVISPLMTIPAGTGTVPVETVSANTPLPVGNTLTVSASGSEYYNWTGPNGFSSLKQSFTLPNITGAQAGTYVLTVRNLYGCSGTPVNTNVQVLTSFTSAQSGDWTTPATWTSNCAGCIPNARTDVTIQAGHTVSLPAGTYQSKQLILNGILQYLSATSILQINP